MTAYTSPHTSFALARLASCADPDMADGEGPRVFRGTGVRDDQGGSPGAVFLRQVETDARERWVILVSDMPFSQPSEIAETFEEDAEHEVADSAVPMDTHERWAVFTDLGAWADDELNDPEAPDGYGMTERAGFALYSIADRLVRALVEEWAAADAREPGDVWTQDGTSFYRCACGADVVESERTAHESWCLS